MNGDTDQAEAEAKVALGPVNTTPAIDPVTRTTPLEAVRWVVRIDDEDGRFAGYFVSDDVEALMTHATLFPTRERAEAEAAIVNKTWSCVYASAQPFTVLVAA